MQMHDKNQQGFTLIEVVIVIAIIAILAAIAIPTYFNYMKKVTRKKTTARMQEIALLLEKNYSQCSRYNVNCATRQPMSAEGFITNPDGTTIYPNDGRSYYYQLQVNLSANDYSIVAMPVENGRSNHQKNDGCGPLGINNSGIKWAWGKGNRVELEHNNFIGTNNNDNYNCWN